jgi:transposase
MASYGVSGLVRLGEMCRNVMARGTTLYDRFSRWRKAGVWDRLMDAVSKRYDGDIVMIDSSCVRVHQHGANAKKGDLPILA